MSYLKETALERSVENYIIAPERATLLNFIIVAL